MLHPFFSLSHDLSSPTFLGVRSTLSRFFAFPKQRFKPFGGVFRAGSFVTFASFVSRLSIPTSTHGAPRDPNQHMATHILTVTVCYSRIIICSIIHPHDSLVCALSASFSSLCFSHKRVALLLSCTSSMLNGTQLCSGIQRGKSNIFFISTHHRECFPEEESSRKPSLKLILIGTSSFGYV